MAAVGCVPAAVYFFVGAAISGLTTWFLSMAMLEETRINLSSFPLSPKWTDLGGDET